FFAARDYGGRRRRGNRARARRSHGAIMGQFQPLAASREKRMTETIASAAHVSPCTEAEGPGKGFALWFQGCPLRCPGCCNPEMLPFEGGEAMTLDEVVGLLRETATEHALEGITLLGGEPLAHAAAGTALAKSAHTLGLNVMVFSGYVLEEARQMPDPAIAELLAETDILVDGPYVRELPEKTRRWIGSANQRIHVLH